MEDLHSNPCNGQSPSSIAPMLRYGSSSLVDSTSGRPYCVWADTLGGLDNGQANTSDPNSMVTHAISPPSFTSNAILDGSSIMHQEQADLENASPMKRQKVGVNQENHNFLPHVTHAPNQRLDSLQNPHLQAFINQQLQQHIPRPDPWIHQSAQKLRTMLQPPFVEGICARRLVQYLDKQRSRPPVNSIEYWMCFVKEYFAPRAKMRWCLASYDNVYNHIPGAFPQSDVAPCDLCGSRSGDGFDINVEVLPRLNQIKFDHGVIDELLFLDTPHESSLPSGIIVLEYKKAVHESVYEQFRVVRNGRLRVSFTLELKILNWEFCAQPHEVFLSRRSVAPQVNQLLRVAQRYHASVTESGSSGVFHQDLEASCNMFLSASHQLAKPLKLQSLNDWGFSKRYVRCVQICQAVNSMKDLIDFSLEHKMGPLESLKNYPQHTKAKLQAQKMRMQQLLAAQGRHSMDQNNLNRTTVIQPGMRGYYPSNNHIGTTVFNNYGVTGAATVYNCQNLLRSSGSTDQNSYQPDPLCNHYNPNGAHPLIPANKSVNSLSCVEQNNQQCSAVDQERVIQLLLQELHNNKEEIEQHTGRQLSSVVAPWEGFNGGIRGLPVQVNARLLRNGTSVDPLAVNSPNSNFKGSSPKNHQ